jgi:hypothetical protein
MEWIERIERVDGRLTPIYVDAAGTRRPGSLRDAKQRLKRTGYKHAEVTGLSLPTLACEDATRYLRGIGMRTVDPSAHDVFAFQHGEDHVLVPTSTLLTGLIARLSSVGDRLLEASSLPRVAFPLVKDGELSIGFPRKLRLEADGRTEPVQRRFTWLTCYPSARRMWSSVYEAASKGRLSMTLPVASIDAAVAGHRSGNSVFVTRLNVKTVYPKEVPLPFAAPFVAPPFHVAADAGGAHRLSEYWRLATTNGSITRDSNISIGPAGYPTTHEEWAAVKEIMRPSGLAFTDKSKSKVDAALLKFGEGRTWASVAANIKVLRSTHQRWVAEGRWAALKEALNELRR